MVNIIDVAKYILHKCGELSTMKLQKLCYYSQAWSLVWDDAPLFEEDFQVWANGPVCKPLFDIHKGRFSINEYFEGLSEGQIETLDSAQRETIDSVLEFYGDKDAQWLSRLTHMEDPWMLARKGFADGEHCESIITKESMSMYYGAL